MTDTTQITENDIDSALKKVDELSAIIKKTEQLISDLNKKKLKQLQNFTKISTSIDGSEYFSAMDSSTMRINFIFFNLNAYISIIFYVFTHIDYLLNQT